MIPATFGALLGFLGLVAPGLVYNKVAALRRSRRDESAFAEVSRVALTSLGFSLVALSVLWLLQRYTRLALPNVGLWLTQGGEYAARNLGRAFFGLVAQVVLACGLAAATAWILNRNSQSRFRDDTIYGSVFRRYRPKNFRAWVYVKLDDGTEFWGHERAHNDFGEAAARAIVLEGNGLKRQIPGESDWQPIGKIWDLVIIDAARIQYMQVIYRNAAGELRGARTDEEPEGEPRNLDVEPIQLQSSISSPAL